METTAIFIFYNPLSGDGQGKQLKRFKNHNTKMDNIQIQIFDILDESDYEKGLKSLQNILHLTTNRIIIGSAGGDGTFVSILEKMDNTGINIENNNISFVTLPFGTGNDLAQALGWKRTISRRKTKYFKKFVEYIINLHLNGNEKCMDIWQIQIETRNDGYIEQSRNNHRDVYRQQILTKMMSNYITLGLQGLVGYGFEQNRHQSRIMNIFEYMRQCLKIITQKNVEKVKYFFKGISTSDNSQYHCSKEFSENSVELVIQNISGIWGRQMNLWDNCKQHDYGTVLDPPTGMADPTTWTCSKMNDGKLDVFAINSRLDYLIKQLRCIITKTKLDRFGQFRDMIIHCIPHSNFHMMVDGEFYHMYNISTIKITPIRRINVLTSI